MRWAVRARRCPTCCGCWSCAPEVTALVEHRELEMGHARALLSLTQRRHQVEVGTLVAKKGLSVRETEALVRSMLARASGGGESKESRPVDPNVQRLQDDLSEKLGAVVQIQHSDFRQGQGGRQLPLAR